MSDETALRLAAQEIPVPKSISPQGQAYLANAALRLAAQQSSVHRSDAAAEQLAREAAAVQFRPMATRFNGSIETIALPSGAKLHRMTPVGRTGRLRDVAYVDIHGGGFTGGGGEMCELLAKIRASDYGAEVYAVDYRLLPHPFPAGLDDCVAAYREILKQHEPSTLVLGGASAGGSRRIHGSRRAGGCRSHHRMPTVHIFRVGHPRYFKFSRKNLTITSYASCASGRFDW